MNKRIKKKIRKALITPKLVTANRAKTLYRWAFDSCHISSPRMCGTMKRIFFPYYEDGMPVVEFAPGYSEGGTFIKRVLSESDNYRYAVLEYKSDDSLDGYMIIDM